jgi:DNA polymerase III alpha subunit
MCIKPKKDNEEMFSDAEIYQKALDCFPNHAFENMKRYHGIKEVEMIFSSTDGKFVFREQFYDICTKIVKCTLEEINQFRKAMITFKKQEVERIRLLFSWRLGDEGEKLFDYLNKGIIYAVAKSYVVEQLFLDFAI